MALKIDLEKAYDKLNWCIIEETLSMISIPSYLGRCIMFCITNSSMQVLWNGKIIEHFNLTRGIY